MEVRNCKGCGRLFNYISGSPLCPDCKKKEEEKFQKVKEYIQDRNNRAATLDKIAEDTGVTVKQIKQWIKEERLYFEKGSAAGIPCEKCGKLIQAGKYCDDCKNKMASNLASALDSPIQDALDPDGITKAARNKMRFLDV